MWNTSSAEWPRCALVIGVGGQDGYYLSQLLRDRGYEVHGTVRPDSPDQPWMGRLAAKWAVDLGQAGMLREVLRHVHPHEIYFLAAHHFPSHGGDHVFHSLKDFWRVNVAAPAEVLDTIRQLIPGAKFFYASSCHVFGAPVEVPQTERTPQLPRSYYGITKSAAGHLCAYFREQHGVFAVSGVLYNHESARRGSSFVTAKIAQAAAAAASGRGQQLVLRHLDAVVDWGAAQDFVHAMHLTLQQASPTDYIVAVGHGHTVLEFADAAFQRVGLDARDWVRQDVVGLPREQLPYIGDSTKLRRATGWIPHWSFQEIVHGLVDYHLSGTAARSEG